MTHFYQLDVGNEIYYRLIVLTDPFVFCSLQTGSPTLRLLHLTDLHFDPAYTEGVNAECGEPLCCRADDGQPSKY